MSLWKTSHSPARQGVVWGGVGRRLDAVLVVVAVCALLAARPALAAPLNRLLLADDSSKKILVYDRATRAYVNEFADASGLLSGAAIVALAANDAGTKVYVAVSKINDFNAAGARIYVYDVAVDGENLTGSNPTLLYQHTLGAWGSRRSMCIGPDRNSDGKQDVYFTVPLPAWGNETVYWVNGVSGGTATSYQNIGTQHNGHLEFRADTGALGWGRWANSMSEARSWRSTAAGANGTGVWNDIGTLKYDSNNVSLGLTNTGGFRVKDILFDENDVIYYSSYYDDTWNDRVYRTLHSAIWSGTAWSANQFTGGGLGSGSYAGGGTSATPPAPAGLQPGVMSLLTVTPLPSGTVILLR